VLTDGAQIAIVADAQVERMHATRLRVTKIISANILVRAIQL